MSDVRDQIGRVFDGDHQPDRGIKNANLFWISTGTPKWVVLAGWLAVRFKVLQAADSKALTSTYLYLFLPALIVEHLSTQRLANLFNGPFIVATLALMVGIYGAVLLVEKTLLRRSLASRSPPSPPRSSTRSSSDSPCS